MEPKTFESLDSMEKWAKENPGEVTRHLVKAWEKIIEEEKENIVVISCTPRNYQEEMNIVVEEGEEEESLNTLLEESVEREDYEAAKKIKDLQKKIN